MDTSTTADCSTYRDQAVPIQYLLLIGALPMSTVSAWVDSIAANIGISLSTAWRNVGCDRCCVAIDAHRFVQSP